MGNIDLVKDLGSLTQSIYFPYKPRLGQHPISKAGDLTTTRSRRSHNRKTTRALYNKLHERLDRFYVPRCFDGKIYVKNFSLLTTSYNTYMTQQYTHNVSMQSNQEVR